MRWIVPGMRIINTDSAHIFPVSLSLHLSLPVLALFAFSPLLSGKVGYSSSLWDIFGIYWNHISSDSHRMALQGTAKTKVLTAHVNIHLSHSVRVKPPLVQVVMGPAGISLIAGWLPYSTYSSDYWWQGRTVRFSSLIPLIFPET